MKPPFVTCPDGSPHMLQNTTSLGVGLADGDAVGELDGDSVGMLVGRGVG